MVLTPKRIHLGNTVIINDLRYAYYGTYPDKERAELKAEDMTRKGNWTYIHPVPGKGFSVFHRDGTLEHSKSPFGKTRPTKRMTYAQARKEEELELQKKGHRHTQKEPGEKGIAPSLPKEARVTLSEQEKRDKKRERRALRREKKRATTAGPVLEI